jgi:hypothetical protein
MEEVINMQNATAIAPLGAKTEGFTPRRYWRGL